MIKCPNCGANTTNALNCEYCGSLLVRFEDKGIDLAHSSYLDDSQTYPGIKNALKLNLAFQKSNSSESVVTDIYAKVGKDLVYLPTVLRSGYALFRDHTNIPTNTKRGLCVIMGFEYYLDNGNTKRVRRNQKEEERHKKLKSLDIFSLFMERISFVKMDGYDGKVYEYFIDFGEDAVGASRLISKIIAEVYGLPWDAQIECCTNVGHDAIEKSREKVDDAFGTEIFTKGGSTLMENIYMLGGGIIGALVGYYIAISYCESKIIRTIVIFFVTAIGVIIGTILYDLHVYRKS